MIGPLRTLYRTLHRTALGAAARLGLNVARTADYYSPLPVRAELERTRARWDRPSAMAGVEWDTAAMKGHLTRLVEIYGGELAELPAYDEAKGLGYGPGFTLMDALVVYLVLRDLKPRRVMEVGSGLSTFYMARAVERTRREGGPEGRITCIDPYSGDRVRGLPGVEVLRRPVQDVAPDEFRELGDGDLLFIDSTHVVKIDGDVPHLYLEVLPRLRPGVTVHSHDVHFPYNVPHPAEEYIVRAKWPKVWTEAMLLQAFLAFNREFEIVLSAGILRHEDEPFLE
ncbi:MAG: class I SAM-dependent methyltransferase, partial [Acidobacteriota bacterium]